MDFKENVPINQSPTEIGNEFFSKPQRTIFGMVLYYRNENDEVKKKFFDFVSECLAHWPEFVKKCFNYFLFYCSKWNIKFNSLSVWCDNGPHFRHKILFDYFASLIKPLDTFHTLEFVYLNFFVENHGKSICDVRFSVLSRFISEYTKSNNIYSTNDLINCIKIKQEESNKFRNDPVDSVQVKIDLKYICNKQTFLDVEEWRKLSSFYCFLFFLKEKVSVIPETIIWGRYMKPEILIWYKVYSDNDFNFSNSLPYIQSTKIRDNKNKKCPYVVLKQGYLDFNKKEKDISSQFVYLRYKHNNRNTKLYTK
jgi:hypothetical protein